MSVGTDIAYQAYLEQINSLRNGLLGTGPVLGTNAGDAESALYYAKVKTLSATFVGVEEVHAKVAEARTEDYYKQIDDFNKGVKETSGLVPLDEIETSPTQFTPASPQPKIKVPDNVQKDVLDKAPDQAKKVQSYFENHNPNVAHNSLAYNGFPAEPGEDVPGHNGDLGKQLANQLKFTVPDGKGGTLTYFKSWATKDNKPDQNTHGTPDNPYTDKLNAMLEEQRKMTPGSYKFFIEKLHGKTIDGKFYKKNEIKPGQTRDQIPNRMVFPAYIMNFNDGYAVNWADYKFIGRGEKAYVYEETTRSLTLDFWMMSDFSADLLVKAIEDYRKLLSTPTQATKDNKLDATKPGQGRTQNTPPGNITNPTGQVHEPNKQPVEESEILKELQRIRPDWGEGTTPTSSYIRGDKTGFIQGQYSGTPEQFWARSTFLAQCCYAWYRKDGKMKEQPFVRVRIGDFFDVVAKIDSLDFTTEEFDMDLNPSVIGAIPMGVKVSMRLTIIHEDEPTSEYPRFYHRADYDSTNNNPYCLPENLQETSKNMDSVLDKNEVKSPVSSVSSLTNYGNLQTMFPNEAKAVLNTLKDFDTSLSKLTNAGNSFKDLAKGEKIKEVLKNALRVSNISKLVDISKIKDIKSSIDLGELPSLKNPTSLANTPVLSNFPVASIPKIQDIPEVKQSLFPQFKTLKSNLSNLSL